MTSGKGRQGASAGTNSGGKAASNREEARQRREALGRSLRRVYQDVVQEPVPDDLAELMRKLDQITEQDG
ncbi:MAG: NepR family anti-sigma factor [Parvibaculum sp.]|uniref:NepR family anti-sigma factor n=1 Tax=Parvibaculum sp. TaxID=2024848 RepID=UPI003C70ACBC